jgi:hypothetical protein
MPVGEYTITVGADGLDSKKKKSFELSVNAEKA